ncbi:hypothetical protein CANARDRAFT_212375 [[Candida] arabinofermentans NRRL YB-2248]|uniref:GPI ethanolamine phosphate transferase 1 n=1 Tax=[Candida] arabinofermentans NRRL YB-2248 TaxID=983967 RepID=A0A1E4T333_9ASCO|nr:hypothetical protein CANARDRAFT_212375 [[Candida] arabinofermentans NRRL YB-2248]
MSQLILSKRALLLIVGVLFHLLYLWSIFDIYFISPLVHGMKHHLSTLNPPAKRLFLIVGDGQRADTTLSKVYHSKNDEFNYLTPYLRSIILNQGTYGISHTRMPTESRPGHVAMIAGFYEDVSAVTKGWKENPVDFDSVFNQSKHTYSFGSPDILPMFATGASDLNKIDTWMYGHEFEDFTSSSIELDKFVFDNLNQLFINSTIDSNLNNEIRQDGNIFFLHLLGTDTAGHSYRPYSNEYYDNVIHTDNQLSKLIPKINEFFNDDKTAFIFTSDHGMSDFGSHGDGHPNNTRTPFICWGAGCKKPNYIDSIDNKYLLKESNEMLNWNLNNIERHDIKQADIASLMSYLIGLNYPSNSVGELPIDFIDGSESDKINALYQNSLSILEQYLVKLSEVSNSQFHFKPFPEFELKSIDDYKSEIEQLIKLVDGDDLDEIKLNLIEKLAINKIETFMQVTLSGLDYLTKYNWLLLRSIVTLGFVGWIVYSFVIFLQLFILEKENTLQNSLSFKIFNYSFFISITLTLSYLLFYQKSPMNYYMYLAFPIFFWNQIFNKNTDLFIGLYQFFKGLSIFKISIILLSIIGFFECITYGFTNRSIFIYLFGILGIYPILLTTNSNSNSNSISYKRLISWLITNILMSFFPSQNPIKTENLTMILIGGLSIILIGIISLIYLNKKIQLSLYTKSLILIQILLVIISIYSTQKSIISLQLRNGLPKDAQLLGWLNLIISLIIIPILHHFKSNSDYQLRFLIIFLTFSPTFIILTISFETLFYVLFSLLVLQWLEIESKLKLKVINSWLQLLRISLIGFFFLQISFFGTGNIASISSFSLDSVYRLIPIFDPFPMGALLMLKLIIPYIILSIGLGLMNIRLNLKIYSISTLVISLSDLLSLNFFFLVKTEGSWLDIGLTISNYCLAILNSLFILILELLSNFLLHNVKLEEANEDDLIMQVNGDGVGKKAQKLMNDNDTISKRIRRSSMIIEVDDDDDVQYIKDNITSKKGIKKLTSNSPKKNNKKLTSNPPEKSSKKLTGNSPEKYERKKHYIIEEISDSEDDDDYGIDKDTSFVSKQLELDTVEYKEILKLIGESESSNSIADRLRRRSKRN